METLTTDLNRASSGADRIRSAYDKEQSRLEELEQLLKELRNRLKQEQKENSELKEQVNKAVHCGYNVNLYKVR